MQSYVIKLLKRKEKCHATEWASEGQISLALLKITLIKMKKLLQTDLTVKKYTSLISLCFMICLLNKLNYFITRFRIRPKYQNPYKTSSRSNQNTRIPSKHPDPTKTSRSNQNIQIQPKHPDPTKTPGSHQNIQIQPKHPDPIKIPGSY